MSSRQRSLWIPFLLIGSAGLAIGFYYAYGRGLVQDAYEGNAPAWFERLIKGIYPRFSTEKERFDLGFFLEKAQQVVWRWALVATAIAGLMFALRRSLRFERRWAGFWQPTTTRRAVHVLVGLYVFALIYTTYDWVDYLWALGDWKMFYRPVQLLAWLPYPSDLVILLLFVGLLLGGILATCWVKPTITISISVLCFLVLQGLGYGFGKVDHGYATFTYAGLLLPLLVFQAGRGDRQAVNGWPLRLIQAVIALAYLQAGLEKLLVSHFEWASVETFRTYLRAHPTPASEFVMGYDWLCGLFAWGALLFQLGFPLVFLHRRIRLIWLGIGVTFHLGTYLLLDVGGWMNPWVFAYLFFIDWERLFFQNLSIPQVAKRISHGKKQTL